MCFVLATSFYRCKEIKKVNNASIRSPRGDINVVFLLDHAGKPAYLVHHKQKLVVDTSYLGFEFYVLILSFVFFETGALLQPQ